LSTEFMPGIPEFWCQPDSTVPAARLVLRLSPVLKAPSACLWKRERFCPASLNYLILQNVGVRERLFLE